jgi:hypothetical protein
VVNGLALTCKFHLWHSWEGPNTTTGAYGIWCKPAHTVHVVNNLISFHFSTLKYDNYYVAISTMHGPLPTLEGADHPSS